jgi:hypothetical protein
MKSGQAAAELSGSTLTLFWGFPSIRRPEWINAGFRPAQESFAVVLER